MLLKKINYFIIAIFFDCSCAHIFGTSISLLQKNQFSVGPDLILDSRYLMAQRNNKENFVSWDLEKIDFDFSKSMNERLFLIFKYLPLSQHVTTGEYFDRLALSSTDYFSLESIDLSHLSQFHVVYADEPEHDIIMNPDKIVFDFSSNQIKDISFSDLCAIYSYCVGLAYYTSTIFDISQSLFIFKDNPLSFFTRMKFFILCTILRLRLFFYGNKFRKYHYVMW